MKIYCMSDIHGCLAEFEYALSLVMEHIEDEDTKLLLLGDYIHGGEDNYGVLDRIMELQYKYGTEKIVALMGNHEWFVLSGYSVIEHLMGKSYEVDDISEYKYIKWMENLPKYYTEGNTIFCHAGIDEEAGEFWEWGTGDEIFIGKYPAEKGEIEGLDMKIVAGHVGTAEIAGDASFHDIYFDGASHYYIDGTVMESGRIPVLMVDTDKDKYYRVTESGNWMILPYDEEN